MISIFGQFSGNGLGYFNATIFKLIGVETVDQQLGYNLLNSAISAIGAGTAVCFTDIMPRRKILVIGTFVCALTLATNAGLSETMSMQDPLVLSCESLLSQTKPCASLRALLIDFLYTQQTLKVPLPLTSSSTLSCPSPTLHYRASSPPRLSRRPCGPRA